jgi:hypothetical protein
MPLFLFPFRIGRCDGLGHGLAPLPKSRRPLWLGRDDSQVLAWYKKFNLCIISLFGTLCGFGGALLFCFFAIGVFVAGVRGTQIQ